jgi:predicted ATPase
MTLPLRALSVSGYRSLQRIDCPVGDLDVFVGANGVGKTNLYRALQLVQSAAANTLALDLAREGGLASAFWAGPRPAKEPARMRFAVSLAAPDQARPGMAAYVYEVEVGFPVRRISAAFETEPQVKEERLTYLTGGRSVRMLERKGPAVTVRVETGRPTELDVDLTASETVLGRLEEPARYPELDLVRRTLREWRFYHDLRTDPESLLRRPCFAVTRPTLASDGSDLAAVFATLVHIRQDTVDLDRMIEDAFPGASLIVPEPDSHARFGLELPEFPGRVFEPSELSDGTLRYLALAGALLAYRLPPFVALNEPEASLHPDLMEPLARLIVKASERTQVWLVTHSERLAAAIEAAGGSKAREVIKREGATWIEGLNRFGAWEDEAD